MSPLTIVLLCILGVLIVVLVLTWVFGKRTQKKQEEQEDNMRKMAQTMSFYIIDKKKLRLKDAGLPKAVEDSTKNILAKIQKMPILKVKIGPKVMTLVCDPEVYKTLLPKQEVKAQVSGIYVLSAKRVRGPIYEPKKHKKGMDKLLDKMR